jgi:hypothetical protein
VLRDRLATEYALPVEFDASEFQVARWIAAHGGISGRPRRGAEHDIDRKLRRLAAPDAYEEARPDRVAPVLALEFVGQLAGDGLYLVARRDAGALRGSASIDLRDHQRPWQQDAFVTPGKAEARRSRVRPRPPQPIRGSLNRFRRGTGKAPPLRRRSRWRRGIGLGAVTRCRWRGERRT